MVEWLTLPFKEMKEGKGKKALLLLCYVNEFVMSFCLCGKNRNFDDYVL